MDEKLLRFFKTFADLDRLKVTALISKKRRAAFEIAMDLDLSEKEVARHLEQIKKLGVLQVEENGYRLDVKAFEALSREVLAEHSQAVQAHSDDEDANDFDRQVVKNYSYPDGRLKEIPVQEKKLLPILRHVVQAFRPGVRYSEKEVNQALAHYHADYASLRRYLIDRQILTREANGRQYWRKDKG
jgi:biotin operon repressor